MAQYRCCACERELEVDTRDLGPIAANLLLRPVTILGADCVTRLGLVVHRGLGIGIPWLLYQGREFRSTCGAFARSHHPRVAHIYTHDES